VERQQAKASHTENMVKKLQYMVTDTMQYATDIAVTKGKMEDLKAANEKRNEQMKEYVNGIKEVLETRVDSIMQFEDRLENLNMEINKCKRTHDDFAERIIDMVGEANKASGDVG
jgi:chromosome segregation ATPase